MGYATITTTFQGRLVVGGLGLAMMKLCTKFEISTFTHCGRHCSSIGLAVFAGLTVMTNKTQTDHAT